MTAAAYAGDITALDVFCLVLFICFVAYFLTAGGRK